MFIAIMKRIRDMKKVCGVIVLSAVLMAASGCGLAARIDSPEFKGQVVDMEGRPIPNAKVEIYDRYPDIIFEKKGFVI
jgi:hypothetical protein